jgi:hypothetical protein
LYYFYNGDIITIMDIQDNQRQAVLYSYLAGIIDGEGTIRIGFSNKDSRGNPTKLYYAAVSVGMTDYRIIKLLADTFGSKVREERVPGRKLMYRWGTSGNKAVPKILEKVMPYLIVKRRQAELVMEFCKTFKDEIPPRERKCLDCGNIKQIRGHGLCDTCYARRLRNKKEMPSVFIRAGWVTNQELQRREDFYRKVRELNAVGAAATTKPKDTREGEVIV